MYVRTGEREWEGENERTSLPFPLTTYPPPLLDRERKKRKREKERKKERKEEIARAREERSNTHAHTDGQGIVCDFVLPLAATSRSHSSISHTRAFSVAPLGRGLHLYLHRQERDGREAVRERTQSGLKSSCAPRCAIIAYGCYNSNLCLQRAAANGARSIRSRYKRLELVSSAYPSRGYIREYANYRVARACCWHRDISQYVWRKLF